ncbi:hypothetical protein OAB94_02170 [Flavobacteriaceae bacterium]|nr:hypothetical protein [Flavobacteriaceae bacterium]
MMEYIGKYPKFFPFPLSVVTIIITWGVAILLHQIDVTYALVTAIILIIQAIVVYIIVIKLSFNVLKSKISNWKKFFGFVDGYISLIHALSGITMAIIVLSNPINQHFQNIPVGIHGYNLFWTYAFSNMLLIFNSAGQGNSGGISALGVLPVILTSITGFFYGTLLWTVISQSKTENDVIYLQTKAPPPRYRRYGTAPKRGGTEMMYSRNKKY